MGIWIIWGDKINLEKYKPQIVNKSSILIKSIIILSIPFVIYFQDLKIIANEALNSELSTHIIALPFILSYILYRLRYVFTASTVEPSKNSNKLNFIRVDTILGILLCTLAYLIRWYGSLSFIPLEYHIVSLPIFVTGLILIIFNVQTLRTIIFPVAFLLFILPPPIESALRIGAILSIESANVAHQILSFFGLPVNLLFEFGTPVISLITASGSLMSFVIDIACSGLYSQIGLLVFSTFFAYISRGSLTRKIMVFLMGIPVIYGLNILRISLIILIGYYAGYEQALKIFHLFSGWILLFIGTTIILYLAEKIFKTSLLTAPLEKCNHDIQENDGKNCLQCGKILEITPHKLNKTDILKIISIILVTFYILSIQVPVFSLTSGYAGVFNNSTSSVESIKNVLPDIEGYQLNFVYRDREFEKISGQNASLMYRYTSSMISDPTVWVGLELSPVKGNLHSWEVCLISWPERYGAGPRVDKVALRDIHLIENPPLSARYFSFVQKDSNTTQVILYWYTQSVFQTEKGPIKMWSKISVIEYAEKPEYYGIAEKDILPVAQAIADYWYPISTWSGIGLGIAENVPILIGITTLVIVTVTLYDTYLIIDGKKKSRELYNNIEDYEDRAILSALKSTEKSYMKKTEIVEKYKDKTRNEIDLDTLNDKLKKAEELGIIKVFVLNEDDRPYVSYKLNFKDSHILK